MISAIAFVCGAAALATFARGLRGAIATMNSITWLHRVRYDGESLNVDREIRFIIVVPLLREQSTLADMLSHFKIVAKAWPESSVVLATTERECTEHESSRGELDALAAELSRNLLPSRIADRFRSVLPRAHLMSLIRSFRGAEIRSCQRAVRQAFDAVPTTVSLAAQLVQQSDHDGIEIRHYHYPDSRGKMPHQVNFAIEAELARLRGLDIETSNVYFAIYNADSRVDAQVLGEAARQISWLAGQPGGKPRVLQHSSLFANNAVGSRGLSGGFRSGSALLQSRWSLAHEIPTWRLQSKRARSERSRWPYLAHCTGHGLFIRGDEFATCGGLPTQPMNEDLPLGFLFSAAGVPVDPFPILELADSPASLGATIRQKRQWFWPYVEYPTIAGLASDRGLSSSLGRTWLVVQGCLRGVAWLGTSPCVLGTLILPLAWRTPAAVFAALAAVCIYMVVPFVLIAREMQSRGFRQTGLTLSELLGGLVAYLAHSIGPVWCCASALHRLATGQKYKHEKTER